MFHRHAANGGQLDCKVTGGDFLAFAASFGKSVGTQGYDPRFDLNNDGVVSGGDELLTAPVFGTQCPHFIYDYQGNLARIDGNLGTNLSPYSRTFIGGIYEVADNGAVTKYYSFDGRRIAMSTKPSGGTAAVDYLAQDAHGNTAYVLSSTGAVVSHTRYYPYGQTWTQESTSPTNKMFDGYTKDGTSSGLYYAGARFYSADLGRFLSPDPVGGNYANPQSLNPYSYVQNNPLTFTDPTGAWCMNIKCGLETIDNLVASGSSTVSSFVDDTIQPGWVAEQSWRAFHAATRASMTYVVSPAQRALFSGADTVGHSLEALNNYRLPQDVSTTIALTSDVVAVSFMASAAVATDTLAATGCAAGFAVGGGAGGCVMGASIGYGLGRGLTAPIQAIANGASIVSTVSGCSARGGSIARCGLNVAFDYLMLRNRKAGLLADPNIGTVILAEQLCSDLGNCP